MRVCIVIVLLCGPSLVFALNATTIAAVRASSTVYLSWSCQHMATTLPLNASLIKAAQQGQASEVTALLARGGVQVDAAQENGWTALMFAVQNRHEAVVKLLLDHGANPRRHPTAYSDTTPLFLAVEAGDVKIARLLLAHGVDVNEKIDTGETALIYAAANVLSLPPVREYRMVEFLLEHGADPHAKDALGNTVLSTARASLHQDPALVPTVRLLEVATSNKVRPKK